MQYPSHSPGHFGRRPRDRSSRLVHPSRRHRRRVMKRTGSTGCRARSLGVPAQEDRRPGRRARDGARRGSARWQSSSWSDTVAISAATDTRLAGAGTRMADQPSATEKAGDVLGDVFVGLLVLFFVYAFVFTNW